MVEILDQTPHQYHHRPATTNTWIFTKLQPNYPSCQSDDKRCDFVVKNVVKKKLLTGLFRIPSCNVNKASLGNREAKRNWISSAVWLGKNDFLNVNPIVPMVYSTA